LRRARGFSLVEVLVAMAIGAFGIAVAAVMARTAVKQSGRGKQASQMSDHTRLIVRQLRADLDVAGMGSTGAVAADCTNPMWGGICAATPGSGFNAIPAVRGTNNLNGTVGGITIRGGSDAIQIIVPDPSTRVTTTQSAPAGSGVIFIPPIGCPVIFISDHSAPNGGGRTQLMLIDNPGSTNPTSRFRLQFAVYEGSDVLCARLSTYWVDEDGWLYRSDAVVDRGPDATLGGISFPEPSSEGRLAPGIEDLQIAYRFSSELTANRGAAPLDRWAFDDEPGGTDVEAALALQGAAGWFEARQVRMSLLSRSLRAVVEPGVVINEPPLEDRADPIELEQGYSRRVTRTSAVLRTLRYFDMTSPSGLRAEPY